MDESIEEALVVYDDTDNKVKKKSRGQKAVRKTLKGTAQLAKLLPTGTVLAFQVLSPPVTHQGTCPSGATKAVTVGLLGCCALSCFVLSFSDSVRDSKGKVRYGIATPSGLWLLDDPKGLVSEAANADEYRVKAMDVAHAMASVVVFAAVAAFDPNVVQCLMPNPSQDAKELLMVLPIIVGLLCSLFFVAFPSKRHGIGFPLSPS